MKELRLLISIQHAPSGIFIVMLVFLFDITKNVFALLQAQTL